MKTHFYFILLIFIFLPKALMAQNPTAWRGPNQSGVYPDIHLLEKWPDSGPEVLWTFKSLGIGYSSPAFAKNKIYISGMEGSAGYIYCLSQDGKLVWKSTYGSEFDASYPGSRSTPVIDNNFVYILSGVGDLACLNADNGRSVWKINILKEFGGKITQWGLNETVVIHENKLICTPGGANNNVVALDKLTGKLIWSSKGMGEISAYCTPLLTKIGSRNLVVTHTENNIIGLDAESGTLLWKYPHVNEWGVHPNTPLFFKNAVFCFSGYGKGGILLQLNEDGSSVTKKWSSTDMDSRTGGAVVLDKKIYGSGDEHRDWQCIDWETGKVDYKTREIGNGVVIAADNKLYFYSQRGELALVRPGNSSFEIISKIRITEGSGQHWAHPVIHNAVLYVRHGNALIAYHVLH